MVCALLVFQTPDLPAPLARLSPWVDWLVLPWDELRADLSAMQHRRFVKTHTPLDGVVLDPRCDLHRGGPPPARHGRLALPPGRQPRSPAHRRAHRPASTGWTAETSTAGRRLAPGWVEHDADPRDELDSLPGVLHHLSDAWARRDEPNVVLVHYDDLATDLAGEMRRIAAHLRIDVAEDRWPELVEAATFDSMRARADDLVPDATGVLKDRARFFRAWGVGGRAGAPRPRPDRPLPRSCPRSRAARPAGLAAPRLTTGRTTGAGGPAPAGTRRTRPGRRRRPRCPPWRRTRGARRASARSR